MDILNILNINYIKYIKYEIYQVYQYTSYQMVQIEASAVTVMEQQKCAIYQKTAIKVQNGCVSYWKNEVRTSGCMKR